MKRIVLTGLAAAFLVVGVTVRAQTCDPQTLDDAPTSRYQLHADGTARDLRTGLMWMRCAMGQTWNAGSKSCEGVATAYTWQDALQAAQSFNQDSGFAGHTDWRVPNLRELMSIERYHCSDPAINLEVFPNTPSVVFWSSTPLETFPTEVWTLNFGTSHVVELSMQSQFALRLVRSGAWPNVIPPPATAPDAATMVN
ncbi:MAG: DUF1566 domain-containing protein [Gammaproteobacteria bacterium]|nr:DUF1566 domain-containing protein [Gammaproteobacteria bacterium]